MSEEEYHFLNDRNIKRAIWSMLEPILDQIENEYGIEYVIGFHLAAIQTYLMTRGAKELTTPIGIDKELVVRVERVKKEGV